MENHDCRKASRGERQQYGCDAEWVEDGTHEDGGYWTNPAMLPVVLNGEECPVCPKKTIIENPSYWDELLVQFGMFRKNILPDYGGMNDQAARGVRLLHLLEGYWEQAQEEKRNREKK